MPKAKKKPAPATITEPVTVAEVLAASPLAQILASHDARAEIEPDQPMPEHEAALAAFQRQREREQAVGGHVERLARHSPGMQPEPPGFLSAASYPQAGLRVNKSLDRSVAAIQFSEDWKASRNGPVLCSKHTLLPADFPPHSAIVGA